MRIVQVLLLGAVLGGSSAAYACSCVAEPQLFPSNDTTSVPTNVVLRALYNFSSSTAPTVSLEVEGSGTPLELDAAIGPGPFLRSFTPRARLSPQTRYAFTIDEQTITFTTGAGEDVEPPSTPRFDAVNYRQSGTPETSSCGIRRTWTLKYVDGDDDQTPAGQLLVFAQSSGSDEPADAVGVTSSNDRELDISMCRTNFQHPLGGSMPVALQVMDLAGNVSALSSTQQACGCTTGPGLVVALAALWLRRKRTSR